MSIYTKSAKSKTQNKNKNFSYNFIQDILTLRREQFNNSKCRQIHFCKSLFIKIKYIGFPTNNIQQ